ncbi:HEAT repeat domain-containing protein [Nocardia sp. FBN12]|uniref:HEAT repeat domain-containing protein n=1 Tax=Nocardia sp. FBN12 TaxID=3419766 RepID=UPI003CFCE4C4
MPTSDSPSEQDLARLIDELDRFIDTLQTSIAEARAEPLDSIGPPAHSAAADLEAWSRRGDQVLASLRQYRKRLAAIHIHHLAITKTSTGTAAARNEPSDLPEAADSLPVTRAAFNYPGMPHGDDWLDNPPAWFHDGRNGYDIRLVRDLAAVGVRSYGLSELAKLRTIPPAIPVFLDWLEHLDDKIPGPEEWGRFNSAEHHKACIRSDLIRNLNDPAAKGNRKAIDLLVGQLRRQPALTDEVRFRAGSALATIAERGDFDLVVTLISEQPLGHPVIAALLRFIGRQKTLRAKDIALAHLEHPHTRNFAIDALGQMKATGVRAVIESYLDDPDPYTRNQARKALARLSE